MIVSIDYLPLLLCSAGQSTSLTPSPSVQQTVTGVVNQTATPNVVMTVSSNFSTLIHQQTSSVNPSSAVTVSFHSSATSTSPSPTTTSKSDTSQLWRFIAKQAAYLFVCFSFTVKTEDDEDDDIEDDTEEKKKIAIIAASCTGGVVLLLGLSLIIWTHFKNENT